MLGGMTGGTMACGSAAWALAEGAGEVGNALAKESMHTAPARRCFAHEAASIPLSFLSSISVFWQTSALLSALYRWEPWRRLLVADVEHVLRAIRGDIKAFEALFAKYQDHAFAVAASILNPPSEATWCRTHFLQRSKCYLDFATPSALRRGSPQSCGVKLSDGAGSSEGRLTMPCQRSHPASGSMDASPGSSGRRGSTVNPCCNWRVASSARPSAQTKVRRRVVLSTGPVDGTDP